MEQASETWNPHMKLEFLKVIIRLVIAGLVGKSRNELKEEISELEKDLNEMKDLKEKNLCPRK